MGILKYYSPYVENSIKIKIHLEENGKLFPEEIIERLNIFTFNLDRINGERIVRKESNQKFENIRNKNYDKGYYYLTLFYKGLLQDMSNLFKDCTSFTEIDLSNFNTYKVKQMNQTFKNCSNVTEIKFSKCKTHNVEEMQLTFNGCNNLRKINLLNLKLKSNELTQYQSMFSGLPQNLEFLLSVKKQDTIEDNKILVYTKDKKINQLTNEDMNSRSTNSNSQQSNEEIHRIPFVDTNTNFYRPEEVNPIEIRINNE